MVTIKEATQNAMRFAQDSLGNDRTRSMRLEEVESKTPFAGNDYWQITLSMLASSAIDFAERELGVALGTRPKRQYKTFDVIKETGEVTNMKIRKFAKIDA